MLTTNPSVLIYLHSESIDMRKSFDGPDEILGGYQGHVMADCYSRNMSVVLAPGSISLYCISGNMWPSQPSSLTRGRPPSAPPPLTPPAKAPVEKGGQAVGWSGREV